MKEIPDPFAVQPENWNPDDLVHRTCLEGSDPSSSSSFFLSHSLFVLISLPFYSQDTRIQEERTLGSTDDSQPQICRTFPQETDTQP